MSSSDVSNWRYTSSALRWRPCYVPAVRISRILTRGDVALSPARRRSVEFGMAFVGARFGYSRRGTTAGENQNGDVARMHTGPLRS